MHPAEGSVKHPGLDNPSAWDDLQGAGAPLERAEQRGGGRALRPARRGPTDWMRNGEPQFLRYEGGPSEADDARAEKVKGSQAQPAWLTTLGIRARFSGRAWYQPLCRTGTAPTKWSAKPLPSTRSLEKLYVDGGYSGTCAVHSSIGSEPPGLTWRWCEHPANRNVGR